MPGTSARNSTSPRRWRSTGMPSNRHKPTIRRLNREFMAIRISVASLPSWSVCGRFPDVLVGHDWLMEMLWRVQRGIPPVTEAEFAELGAWFEANEERLATLADSSGLFDVGHGRRTCCSSIRYALRQGPRAEGAGELAEDIRQLRARYGDRGS
jgi:hypothetical protein